MIQSQIMNRILDTITTFFSEKFEFSHTGKFDGSYHEWFEGR
ncbi:MAG: hypothetical protein QME58_11990 [Bacteroidota bacterium]|nr:hypothetical protein [Bacteroidota bacterium]